MMRHTRGEGMEEIRGLTKEQVESRIREGKVNLSPKPVVKSYRQIIVEHTFNLFNAYNFCIALALVAVKAWTSLFFVVIVSSNAFLRIYQEIKSRNMVAKLNLIISPKTTVVREGEKQEIRNEEIALMLFEALVLREQPIETTVVNTSTALLGMLPVGLVLLASISMMASVVRLGHKNVVVQEMFSIETLSLADTLCLDKTGTLTQGKMEVQKVKPLNGHSEQEVQDIMISFIRGSLDSNATFLTMADHFKGDAVYACGERVSFSSARKWSALELKGLGTLVLGAPEFIRPDLVFDEEIESARADGARVLLAALAGEFAGFQDRLSEAEPIAAIIISDPLREDAAECIRFFQENEVDIKIISGDNPKTVSALARQAGVRGAQHCVDASLLQSDEEIEEAILNHSVIGRASPQQKHKMILTLQQRGHKVAMTGDGVNDVLALKDADVSIAMGNGSDAAKQISQFVVINGELSTLAEVVKEGRLDRNNVTRSASMYYLKTIYTILISLIILVLNIPYPFIPFQMTLLDNFVAGFPSFMILFERNIERQKESIGRHALRYSLPNALAIVMAVIAVHLIGTQAGLNQHEVFTILYFSTSLLSIHMIYRIYSPLNWYRALVLVLDVIGFILASLLFYDWLQLAEMNVTLAGYIVIIVIAGFILASIIAHLVNRYLDRNPQVKPKKVIMRQTMPAEK